LLLVPTIPVKRQKHPFFLSSNISTHRTFSSFFLPSFPNESLPSIVFFSSLSTQSNHNSIVKFVQQNCIPVLFSSFLATQRNQILLCCWNCLTMESWFLCVANLSLNRIVVPLCYNLRNIMKLIWAPTIFVKRQKYPVLQYWHPPTLSSFPLSFFSLLPSQISPSCNFFRLSSQHNHDFVVKFVQWNRICTFFLILWQLNRIMISLCC